MSFQVPTAFVNQYKSNVELLLQQKGSKLRPYVRNETQSAEFDFYDRISATAAQKVTTRHGDTPLNSTPHDRRRVGIEDYDWADLIDKPDKIRMLIDPTSPYALNAMYAMGRSMDDAIIEAAFGTAYSGKSGGTSVTFPAGDIVAVNYVESGVAANSNLTIGKLRRVKQLMMEAEVDEMEPLIAVVSPSQITSLLRTTEVTSEDYNTVKALVNGSVDTFMGFKFIWHNRLPVSSNIREAMFFAQSGLLLATGQDIIVDIGPRRDKRNAMQVYVTMTIGATRMEEGKVYKVLCDETA